MKTSMSRFSAVFIPLCCVFALLVFTGTAYAQNCLAQLPAVCQAAPYNLVPGTTGITALGCPNSSTTAAQDQNYAMCIQGLQKPTTASNPPLSSSRGNDPYAPPNAFPGTPTSAANINSSNWTDAENHTIVRWGWGAWTTYDDSQGGGTPNRGCGDPLNGSPTCTKALELGTATGGAMNGAYGDYGPAGGRTYPTTLGGTCSSPGCQAATAYPPIDLFTMKDGVTKILTPTDWWVKRRPEIWNLVQKEIYGNAFPDSFNGGAVLSPATTPYPSAISNWTISTGTPGTVAGNISVSTVAGQPTNAPTYPTGTLPTISCPVTGTGNCTGTYRPPVGTPNTSGVAGATVYTFRTKTYTAQFNVPYNGFSPRATPTLAITCSLPTTSAGKVPVLISMGGSPASSTLPYGYGGCSYTPGNVQADAGGAATSDRISGMINGGQWRQPADPGTLVGWAWGISRFIDFLAAGGDADPMGPDPDKVAVEGHSRYGKGTLVTMAYDKRVVAGLPSCGGEGGTSWIRRSFGESIESIVGSGEYYWMAGYLMNYAGAECSTNPNHGPPGCTPAFFPRAVQDLDVDSDDVIALLAPRAVMTNGGTDTPAGNGDAWQDPRGMYLSGALASPTWTLLGWTGNYVPAGTVFTSNPLTWSSTESSGGPNGGESIGGTPPFNTAFAGPNGPGGAGSATVAWRRHTAGHTDAPELPVFTQWAAQYLWDVRPVITAGQSFTLPAGAIGSLGTVAGVAGGGGPLQNWQITGGANNGGNNSVNAAEAFAIDPNSANITIADKTLLDAGATTYALSLMVGDSLLPSTKLGVDATVTIQVPPDILADGLVTVTKGAFVYNFTTGRFNQQIRLTNLTQNPVPGPISVVLDNLSSNATLYNPSGTTSVQLPAGSPYANTSGLAAGASETFTLSFIDPTRTPITYSTPRVLAGSVPR